MSCGWEKSDSSAICCEPTQRQVLSFKLVLSKTGVNSLMTNSCRTSIKSLKALREVNSRQRCKGTECWGTNTDRSKVAVGYTAIHFLYNVFCTHKIQARFFNLHCSILAIVLSSSSILAFLVFLFFLHATAKQSLLKVERVYLAVSVGWFN